MIHVTRLFCLLAKSRWHLPAKMCNNLKMSKLPSFPSNKRAWNILVTLVFGVAGKCPLCTLRLKERYDKRYLWCRKCRKKFRPTSYKSSWLYGMKISPRQLFILIWCWKRRKSKETAMLLGGVSHTTTERWYERFERHAEDAREALQTILSAMEKR